MYESPTRGDFQRNLSEIIHKAHAKVKIERGRIITSFAAKGLAPRTALISQIVTSANDVHSETIKMSVELIHQFTKRSQQTPAELGAAAYSMLANLASQWLGPLLTNKYPQPHGEHAAVQYTEEFRQRLAGALRDAEIGFSGGRDVTAKPPIMVLNNITVDDSVIGSINTGNVGTIDVSLTNLHNAGHDEARNALKALTEAVVNDMSISDTQKNELLDQITFLSEQTVADAKDRKPGLIKATFSAVTEAAQTVTSMAGAWQVAEPILRILFGP
jgi:hypothetical protein